MAPHFDLLLRLWKVWHLGAKVFHKVKAHAEGEDGLSPLQIYHRLGNQVANDSAIHARAHILPAVVAEFEDACVSQLEQQKHLQHMFHFHLAANKRMAQLHQEQKHEDSVMATPRPTWEQLKNFSDRLSGSTGRGTVFGDPPFPSSCFNGWCSFVGHVKPGMTMWQPLASHGMNWCCFSWGFQNCFSLCGNRISRGGRSWYPFGTNRKFWHMTVFGVCKHLYDILFAVHGAPLRFDLAGLWQEVVRAGFSDFHQWICSTPIFSPSGLGIWSVAAVLARSSRTSYDSTAIYGLAIKWAFFSGVANWSARWVEVAWHGCTAQDAGDATSEGKANRKN